LVSGTNHYKVENREHDADDLVGAAAQEATELHRKRIEPWLSAIFQSEHLNLLVGSGFSIGLARAANAPPASMARVNIDPAFDAAVATAAAKSASGMGRDAFNVEDQFRAAIALSDGLSILQDSRAGSFEAALKQSLATFAGSIITMENSIAMAGLIDADDEERFQRLLTEFVLSFASRTASRDHLHIFTTNYDRLIEHGFDLLGIRPIDRFVGALTPRFRRCLATDRVARRQQHATDLAVRPMAGSPGT
jgi:hypothetical protein